MAFLYANDKIKEIKLFFKISFTIEIQIICLVINLTKEVKDIWEEKYKLLWQVKNGTRRNENISLIHGSISVVKMAVLSKALYRLKFGSNKNTNDIFKEIDKML